MSNLNKKEQDFLFNELASIQYKNLKDSKQKEYLKFMIEPIIRKAKIQLDRLKYRTISPFESEGESQLLFKERFKPYLDLAIILLII